jgi:hypothetical protein
MSLLEEFEEIGKEFLESESDDQWQSRRMVLYRIDRDMGQASSELRPYIPTSEFLNIGSFRHKLLSFWENTHSLPARDSEHWSARKEDFEMLKRESRPLRMFIQRAETNEVFAEPILKEIAEIYCSTVAFLVPLMRRCFTKRNRRPHQD